jgi:hypothetical protein
MKKKAFGSLAIFALCLSQFALAQGQGTNQKPRTASPKPSAVTRTASTPAARYLPTYGMGGCGIGSLVISENSKGAQIGSAFINFGLTYFISTFFSPTWAMSSGSSNCTDRPAEVAMEQEVFLENNLAALSKDAARGEGERLEAFAEVMGCTDNDTKQMLSELSQQRHEFIFSSANPHTVLENYVEFMRASPALKEKCHRLG